MAELRETRAERRAYKAGAAGDHKPHDNISSTRGIFTKVVSGAMVVKIKLFPDRSVKMKPDNGKQAWRRVVVTGMGVVSPNGIGAEAFWRATRAGVSGVDTITLFDPASLSCHITGELKSFNP